MEVTMAFVVALILACSSIFCIFTLVAFVHDYLVFSPLNTGGMMSVIEWWYPLAFFLILGLCWFLAGLSKGMFLVNGSGTKLFGRTPTQNGYIATKWICVMFLPILPVDSYEVAAQQNLGMQTNYIMNQLEDLYWPQIFQTAMKGFLSLVGVVVGLAILFNIIFLGVL